MTTIGKWTVISDEFYVEGKSRRYKHVICRCECGTEKSVRVSSLGKDSFMCSKCANKLNNDKRSIPRDIKLGIKVTKIKLPNGTILIDTKFRRELLKIKWRLADNKVFGQDATGKTYSMHRFIFTNILHQDITGLEIDHINRNPWDNRLCNLNIVSSFENAQNKRSVSNNKKVGVNFDTNKNMWRARINVKGKDKHLGYFNTYEEAVKTRELAEIQYYKYREKLKGEQKYESRDIKSK